LAAGLKQGDEVITTAMTFCSTVNAILHAGATPVLVDVNANTINMDPDALAQAVTPRTRAVLPVHFAGRPCDMDAITAVTKKYDLKLIEDCAHAIETQYHSTPAGCFGEFGCFSFYVTKNLITGEGGMVLTRHEPDAARIKILGLHGMSKDAWKRFSDESYTHYQVTEAGFKYNMMDIQAAMGIHQLKRIEEYWLRRREIWEIYNQAFSDLPVTRPADPAPDTRHAYHLYTIMIDKERTGIERDRFLAAMKRENIGTGVHYLSIPEHPYYQETFGWNPNDFPAAKKIGRETISLPLSAKLSDDDVKDVIRAVRKVLGR
jgi:dTDP-4-amino-4,6-dideoxygalactose transaminase